MVLRDVWRSGQDRGGMEWTIAPFLLEEAERSVVSYYHDLSKTRVIGCYIWAESLKCRPYLIVIPIMSWNEHYFATLTGQPHLTFGLPKGFVNWKSAQLNSKYRPWLVILLPTNFSNDINSFYVALELVWLVKFVGPFFTTHLTFGLLKGFVNWKSAQLNSKYRPWLVILLPTNFSNDTNSFYVALELV